MDRWDSSAHRHRLLLLSKVELATALLGQLTRISLTAAVSGRHQLRESAIAYAIISQKSTSDHCSTAQKSPETIPRHSRHVGGTKEINYAQILEQLLCYREGLCPALVFITQIGSWIPPSRWL